MYTIYRYNLDGSKNPINSFFENEKSFNDLITLVQGMDQNYTYSIELSTELGFTVLYG